MLLLEWLVIYISIRKNYHPIKRLVDLAVHIFEPADRKPLGEIETIRYALGELASANHTLDAKVKQTIPIIRENLLFELVSGRAPDWETFCLEAEAYGIAFPHPAMAVAVLSIEAGGTAEGSDLKRAGVRRGGEPAPADRKAAGEGTSMLFF